jgi:hypothetical protein
LWQRIVCDRNAGLLDLKLQYGRQDQRYPQSTGEDFGYRPASSHLVFESWASRANLSAFNRSRFSKKARCARSCSVIALRASVCLKTLRASRSAGLGVLRSMFNGSLIKISSSCCLQGGVAANEFLSSE